MDWITGLVTLLSSELIGRHRWEGWAVGLANQALWLVLIWQQELWGLLPLPVILSWRFAAALRRWRQEQQAAGGMPGRGTEKPG